MGISFSSPKIQTKYAKRMSYKYQMHDCDVSDRKNLESFRALRTKWIVWLDQIWNEICAMLSNDAYFRLINEARKLAEEFPDKNVGFNAGIASMIDVAYGHQQVMTVRRLNDSSTSVVSLRGLLLDIRKNLEKITREVYVSYDALPYDYSEEYQKFLTGLPLSNGLTRMDTHGPKAWSSSERVHQNFDIISGVLKSNRKRTDRIPKALIDKKLEELNLACNEISDLSHNYIAHKADEKRRPSVPEWKLNLNKIQNAQKAVCKIAQFVSGPLLWDATRANFMPVHQYSHLEDLDKAWVSAQNYPKLRKFWRDHEDSVNSWDEE